MSNRRYLPGEPDERSLSVSSFPSKSEFAAHVDSHFQLRDDAGAQLDLQLVEVWEGGSSGGQEQFSLLFNGPSKPLMPQRIYSLIHSELGTIDLFLVPTARSEVSASYEAVVTRLLDCDIEGAK